MVLTTAIVCLQTLIRKADAGDAVAVAELDILLRVIKPLLPPSDVKRIRVIRRAHRQSIRIEELYGEFLDKEFPVEEVAAGLRLLQAYKRLPRYRHEQLARRIKLTLEDATEMVQISLNELLSGLDQAAIKGESFAFDEMYRILITDWYVYGAAGLLRELPDLWTDNVCQYMGETATPEHFGDVEPNEPPWSLYQVQKIAAPALKNGDRAEATRALAHIESWRSNGLEERVDAFGQLLVTLLLMVAESGEPLPMFSSSLNRLHAKDEEE
jgi:hypothetical protein